MRNIPVAGEDADTLLVYTSKSGKQIAQSGGSGRWALDPARVARMKWLVCVQNRRGDLPEFDADAPLNSAFLLGKISGVQNVTEPGDTSKRWFVALDEVAYLKDYPDMWDGKRAPVRYTTLAGLGIDPERETFERLEHRADEAASVNGSGRPQTRSAGSSVAQMIAKHKANLAADLGVDPAAIEVVVAFR